MNKYQWVFERFTELPEKYCFTHMVIKYFCSERLRIFYYNNVWNETEIYRVRFKNKY